MSVPLPTKLPEISHPGLFADLGKPASVLLFTDKDFNNKDRVTFTSTSTDGVKNITKFTKEDNKVQGSVEFKLPKYAPYGLESSFTFDTKGKVKGSASSVDKVIPGLKLTVGTEIQLGEKQKQDVNLTAEYKHELLTGSAKLTIPVAQAVPDFLHSTLTTAFVLGSTRPTYNVALGVEGEFALQNNQFKSFNAVFQYKKSGLIGTFYSKHGFGKEVDKESKKPINTHICGVTAFFNNLKWGNNAELAADLQYDTYKQADNVTVAVGAGWNVGTTSRINTKIDSNGTATVIFTNQLNSNVTVRLGGDVDLRNSSISKGFVELNIVD